MGTFPTCSSCAKWIIGKIIGRGKCREDGSITNGGYTCPSHSDRQAEYDPKEDKDEK